MNPQMVLIVGAGPTGLTAAIELKRQGFEVRVVDKATQPAQHSQALVVQARTLEQLQRYGVADEAIARGRKLTRGEFWSSGKLIANVDLKLISSRYPYALFLGQNETEAILNEHMESLGVRAERGVELLELTSSEGGAEAVLRHPDGREERVAARWIIGCDGAHSIVRKKSGIQFEGGGVPISFYLGDMEIDGPDAPDDQISLHFHHGDVVFMGRLNEKFTRLIIASHQKQDESTDRQLTLEDFQKAVDNAGVRVRVKSADWMTPFRVHDLQAQRYRAGNVFLAGDAAHIHSPVGGQGMNTGMQDMANLAWKLAAVARGARGSLLDSYYEERGAVGKALLHTTGRGLKMATVSNRLLEEVRDAVMPVLSQSRPVQEAMVGFVSETTIAYRSSSIVTEHGGDGDLQAGDRMPDLSSQGSGILQNWADGRHLALLLDGKRAEVAEIQAALPFATAQAICTDDLDERGREQLGTERKLLIVRPDGYIGYRGFIENAPDWMTYAQQDALAVEDESA